MYKNEPLVNILVELEEHQQFLMESYARNGYRFFLHPLNYHHNLIEIEDISELLIRENIRRSILNSTTH